MAKILFSATAGLYIEFLDFLKENEISLYQIKYNPLGFKAICEADDYFFIADKSKKFQTKVRVEEKKGIYFKIRKILKRKGIIVSVVLFYLLVLSFFDFIWAINIRTTDATLKNSIAGQLFRQGIYTGSLYSEELLSQAVENIMLENNNLGYITLNFYKGILDCNIYKRTEKEEYINDLGNDNIYADKSGIITEIRVYDGFSQVQLGQSVSQGDILVSNLYTDRHGNSYTANTRAYVEAECDQNYRIFVPFEKNIPIMTGVKRENKSIMFAGKEILLKKPDLNTWQDFLKTEKIEYFSFMGFKFPLTVKTDTYYQLEKVGIKKDVYQALYYGKLQLQRVIENDEKLKKENSRSYGYKIHTDGMDVFCQISGIYEIT